MKDYYSAHRVAYENPNRIGFLNIPMLHFLIGHPWDHLALNFVHALKPSCIRVTKNEEKTDCVCDRVTVHVDTENIITSIHQECDVGLDPYYDNGHDLYCEALRKGIKL